MSCPDKIALRAYLTPHEYEIVKKKAAQASRSVSAYVRAVCLGHEVRSTVDHDAVLALLKINADLGRLGGLLKLSISQKAADVIAVRELLEGINSTRRRLDEKIKSL